MLLSLKDVKVHYGRVEALKGVSLEAEEGAIVGLLGANGAGKSTVLRAISGLKALTTGEIWFRGERIDGASPQSIVSKGIALVPEGRKLFPFMTVRENLRLGAYLRKDRSQINKDLKEIMEHFPILEERKGQQAGRLSGGEQQMLSIGRALMSKPTLLLMDEPSLGLSPLMVTEIANIIVDINKGGVSIVLVEQNARLALSLAHKGYVLETGNVVLEGDAQELIDNEHVKKAYLGG